MLLIFIPRKSNFVHFDVTCLWVEGTFFVNLLIASASEHYSSDISVAFGTPLISFKPGCLPFTCDLVGLAPLTLTQELPIQLWRRLFLLLNKVDNWLGGRPFTFWILKIRLSLVKRHFRSISDIKLETFRYKKALLIFVNTHVPIKIGTKIFWWHFKTPNLDLI